MKEERGYLYVINKTHGRFFLSISKLMYISKSIMELHFLYLKITE
jgi:hypothetical protein